jgi:hypothetical protein
MQGLPKLTQIDIFGLKIDQLATLLGSKHEAGSKTGLNSS